MGEDTEFANLKDPRPEHLQILHGDQTVFVFKREDLRETPPGKVCTPECMRPDIPGSFVSRQLRFQ
jgi:hypothetical protein